jgi:A/G-specific adenine glycosylase
MDLGATICTPRNPACGICPWRSPCRARAEGTAAALPARTPRKIKPIRLGIAYVARRIDGAVLIERRPDSGLLGGMLGWPCSDWTETPPEPAPPIRAEWRIANLEARHTFTHFHLRLQVLTATVPMDRKPVRGDFVDYADFSPAALPTAMRKVYDLVSATLRPV